MMKRLKILMALGLFGLLALALYWYAPYKVEGYGYYHKIWAHRANSIEKANKALDYFKGVELDLMYDKTTNTLDVNHPPAESINLSFERYLSEINLKEMPFLWLDIKNLNGDNAYLIQTKLVALFKTHNYDLSKVLVESTEAKVLPIFDRAGFLTSYYLPYGLSLRKPKDLEKKLSGIKRYIKYQPNLMLSSDYQDYAVVNKYFPKHYKCFWAIERPINNKYDEIRTVLKDTMVKVVLLNYRALNADR